MDTMIWAPDPGEVEYKLTHTSVSYPKNVREINFGYAKVQVIPTLYKYVCSQGEVPEVNGLCKYLWQFHEFNPEREAEAKLRTEKLVLDFYRELHTFGLLAKHNAFGMVRYSKATDIDMGVDYLARISQMILSMTPRTPKEVGIQSAIGAKHAYSADGYYQSLKNNRKVSRGAKAWDGPVYWLTNENRPALVSKPSGVWLFTYLHIADLVEEISGAKDVAVQARMFGGN